MKTLTKYDPDPWEVARFALKTFLWDAFQIGRPPWADDEHVTQINIEEVTAELYTYCSPPGRRHYVVEIGGKQCFAGVFFIQELDSVIEALEAVQKAVQQDALRDLED